MSAKKFFNKTDRPARRGETIIETSTMLVEDSYGQLHDNADDYLKYCNDKYRLAYILIWLSKQMHEEGSLPASSQLEKAFKKDGLGCRRSFYDAMGRLEEQRILINPDRGFYRFNPLVVWKGARPKRKKMISHLCASGHQLEARSADEMGTQVQRDNSTSADGLHLKIAK